MAGGAVHALAVELERRAAALDEVELLVVVVGVRLVVLVDDPVARLATRPRVHVEGRDAEVVPDGPPRAAAVTLLLDLVEMRYCVAVHGTSCGSSFVRRAATRRCVPKVERTRGDASAARATR